MPDWLDNIKKLTDELPEDKRAEATKALEKVFKPDRVEECENKSMNEFDTMHWPGDFKRPRILKLMNDYCKCIRRFSR